MLDKVIQGGSWVGTADCSWSPLVATSRQWSSVWMGVDIDRRWLLVVADARQIIPARSLVRNVDYIWSLLVATVVSGRLCGWLVVDVGCR